MKNLKKLILVGVILLLATGCSFSKDSLEDSTIYTTIHPIKYLTEYLYKDYGTIKSIYPNGADVTSYEPTDKQLKEYAQASLFIYNGLSNEKTIAKNLINKNRNLLIIDVSYGLAYTNDVKEMWMSPNNYLMLAKNIKDNLTEYLSNKIIIEYVEKRYQELAENLSLKDADLRSVGREATEAGTNTLVVSDNTFKFLENYGFNIISLDEKSITDSSFAAVASNFEKGTYNTIFVLDGNNTDKIKSLVKNYKATTIDVSSMTTLDDNSSEDYLVAMQKFIDNVRNVALSN